MEHETVRNTNGVATAALIFAIVAAVFSALIYFTLPMMVQRGVENVEAMKVGGHEKYEQLKAIYKDNAAVFGEQVDQIQQQIDMYKNMQASSGANMGDTMQTSVSGEQMPSENMNATGDELMVK